MTRWQWPKTLFAALMVYAMVAAYGRGIEDGAAKCRTWQRTIPLDTVPCGHLTNCTPLVRVRYMSVNPFKQGE
jgi:hypothetical protein